MKLKMILGLCFAMAMLVSAVVAQGASAQTAYTCEPVAGEGTTTEGFADESCTVPTKNTATEKHNVKFEHKEIKELTKITGSGGVTKLKSVSSGVELELQSTSLTGSGTMENKEEGGEMFARGTGTITYAGVTVTKPAGLGCTSTSPVTTTELEATTKGLTNELKFVPKAGPTTAFATFTISGCSIAALNHAYTAKGSVKGQTGGTMTNFTHANTTTQGTLTLQGQLAGIEGELTIRGANGNGLALT